MKNCLRALQREFVTKRLFFFSDLITVKGVLGMEGFGAGEEEEYSLSVLIVLTSLEGHCWGHLCSILKQFGKTFLVVNRFKAFLLHH